MTTGVPTNRLKTSGRKSNWLLMTSNWSARSKQAAMCSASNTLASSVRSSSYPAGAWASRRAEVRESAVANRVTSWPRATSPSVSVDATCSHGP